MDVLLIRKASPDFIRKTVGGQLPRGIEIVDIKDKWLGLPSLQSQLRFAEYRIELGSDHPPKEMLRSIQALMGNESLPWEHARGEKIHKYDLRRLIDDIWLEDSMDSQCVIGMRLYNDARGSGRPDQVILALGCRELARSIHRTRLIMDLN